MQSVTAQTLRSSSRPSAMITVARRAMRLRQWSLAIVCIVMLGPVAYSQTPPADQGRDAPDFRVQVWGEIIAEFSARVSRYAELRSALEVGLPPFVVTDDPADIQRAQRALAREIRRVRAGATQGEFFTPAVSAEIRRMLSLAMTADTLAAIMEENPGEFSLPINGTYPTNRPLSTVPPNILALLPRLPDDIQYRFVGRYLVLHDARANVILDRLPCAIQCTDRRKM